MPSPKPATPAIKADVPPLPIVIFRPIVRVLVSVMVNSPFPMTIKPVPRAEVPKAGDVRPAFRAACPGAAALRSQAARNDGGESQWQAMLQAAHLTVLSSRLLAGTVGADRPDDPRTWTGDLRAQFPHLFGPK
jgi:hypothetical protein